MAIERFVEIESASGRLRLKMVPAGVHLESTGTGNGGIGIDDIVPLEDLEEAVRWLAGQQESEQLGNR